MKLMLLLLSFAIWIMPAAAQDVHTFSCIDSDNSDEPSSQAGRTEFTWVKNGETIFNRTFSDAYSQTRQQYVTFYCEDNNIIRYRLNSCEEAEVEPLCAKEKPAAVAPVLSVVQQSVDTSVTLIDGEDYQFITHYRVRTLDGSQAQITELNFVNDVDQSPAISLMETQASEQYQYTLMGPSSELVSGVTSNNGRLYFNLSNNPISIGPTAVNIGIAAKPKAGLESTGNSGIRWVLNRAMAGQGIKAFKDGQEILFNQINVLNSKVQVFSRGLSGLKLSHFSPPSFLFTPNPSPQGFYRMRVENISSENQSQIARLTLDMRLIGMRKAGGDLAASDFSLVEIGPDASVVGTPDYRVYPVEDSRNDHQNFSFMVEIANFVVPPNTSRGLEFRVANLINDEVNESDDDGIAVQLKVEQSTNVDKSLFANLPEAFWVWTDFSGQPVGNDRNDWRSGVNLDVEYQPLIVRE